MIMVESKLTYEECRRQRMEENKRRMEELNLSNLAQALKPPTTPKSTPVKPRARLPAEPVRRSGRMADKPPPNYKEMAIEPFEKIRRTYQRRDLLDRVRASDEVRQYAIERADKVVSELDPQFPSFIKPMLQSHVSGGFWLGLPSQFCKKHLPVEDETIALVDEDGDESQTKYLAQKNGLSGGWRGFSIDHELVDGDVLVFQLVKPTQFKVYIIRAHVSDRDDNEESKEDNEATPLSRSGKRGRERHRSVKDDNGGTKENNEDIGVTPPSRSGRKARGSRQSDDDDDEKSEEIVSDINVAPSSKNTKRTTRARKK